MYSSYVFLVCFNISTLGAENLCNETKKLFPAPINLDLLWKEVVFENTLSQCQGVCGALQELLSLCS